MNETPEAVWAFSQAREASKAKEALRRWDALSPEEQQRRMTEMEQRIQRGREIKKRMGLGRNPAADRF